MRPAKPDRVAPVFAVDVAELGRRLDAVASAAPRTKLVASDGAGRHYTQTSALFRFVDDVHVRLIPLKGESSTLAILSASRVGYSDMGVNRQRVEAWLKALSA